MPVKLKQLIGFLIANNIAYTLENKNEWIIYGQILQNKNINIYYPYWAITADNDNNLYPIFEHCDIENNLTLEEIENRILKEEKYAN